MKKALRLFVVSLLLIGLLAACGGGNDETTAQNNTGGNAENTEGNSENVTNETYPNSPIEMIVGFGEGGGTDTMARIMQPELEEALGVPIAVRNITGASSAVAMEHVYDQPADGQTILFQADLIRVMPTMAFTDLTYEDFVQIGIPAMGIANFVVDKDSPLETFDDLVKKMTSEGIKVSTAGLGDPWHLTIEIVKNIVGGEVELITYDSGQEAAMAARRGEVDVGISGVNEVVDMLRAGEVRSLAVMDNKPFDVKDYEAIPPVTDYVAELEEYVPEGTWWGPAVKAGTPDHIIEALQEAYQHIVESPDFNEFLEERAIVPLDPEDPQDYARQDTEYVSWLFWDIGVGERAPDEVGIERPE